MMLLSKIKVAVAVLLVGVTLAAGGTGLVDRAPAADGPSQEKAIRDDVETRANMDEVEQLRSENEKLRIENDRLNRSVAKVERRQADNEGLKLKSMVAKVLEAHGGMALGQLRSFTQKVRQTEANGKESTLTYFVQLPDQLRIEVEHAGDPVVEVQILGADGMRYWRKHEDGRVEKIRYTGLEPPPEYWKDFLNFFGPREVLRLVDSESTLSQPLDEIRVDGRTAVGIRLTKATPDLKLDLKMYFDKETHRLLKEENSLAHSDVSYSDYEDFAGPDRINIGFPIARTITRKEDDRVTSDSRVVEFRNEGSLDAKLFQQP